MNKIISPSQLLKFMNDLEYAWTDQKGNKRSELVPEMYEEFSLMSPREVFEKKYGICVDQVEFERWWFKSHNYIHETYMIEIHYKDSHPGHSFLIYQDEKGWNWFENAWYDKRGIHTFKTKDEVLEYVKISFMKQNNILDYDEKNMYMYAYDELPSHINYKAMDEITKLEKLK